MVTMNDDEVNEYFTSNNVSTTKFKKGSFASFGLSKLVLANITRKGSVNQLQFRERPSL